MKERAGRRQLLALSFGVACSAVLAGVAYTFLRPKQTTVIGTAHGNPLVFTVGGGSLGGAGGVRVLGHAIDRTTWTPIAGADLRFTDLWGWPSPVVSDEHGAFAFNAVAAGDRRLLVRHEGHVARLVQPLHVQAGVDLPDLIVELDPESVIEGTLFDAAGAPLLEPQGILVFRDDHAPQPSGEEMLYAETKEGHFRVRGVAAGRQRVGVVAPVEGDVAWKLDLWLRDVHDDQPVDVTAGQTVEVTLQESIPISLPAPSKH